MRALAPLFLAVAALAAPPPAKVQAPAPPSKPAPAYVPDLAQWRLDLQTPLGGWSSRTREEVRILLADPRDPHPPRADAPEWDPWSATAEGQEALLDQAYGGEEDEGGADEQRLARRLKYAQLAAERETREKANAWRRRPARVWFNGQRLDLELLVNRSVVMELEARDGENRLEVLEPTSGLRLVRTWWVSSHTPRLRVSRVRTEAGDEGSGGSLQVMEPDGQLALYGRRTPSGGLLDWSDGYRHDNPPAGTYTLKWAHWYTGGAPCEVCVEVVLDEGTDREKRWRFTRTVLPGQGSVILGTVDVED